MFILKLPIIKHVRWFFVGRTLEEALAEIDRAHRTMNAFAVRISRRHAFKAAKIARLTARNNARSSAISVAVAAREDLLPIRNRHVAGA